MVDNVFVLIPYFGYRTHHEFIIESVRIRTEQLYELRYKMEEVKAHNTKLESKSSNDEPNDAQSG